MARWGLVPFWMKEKPKVPHIIIVGEADRLVSGVHDRMPVMLLSRWLDPTAEIDELRG